MMIDEQTLDRKCLTGRPLGKGNRIHGDRGKNASSSTAGAAR